MNRQLAPHTILPYDMLIGPRLPMMSAPVLAGAGGANFDVRTYRFSTSASRGAL